MMNGYIHHIPDNDEEGESGRPVQVIVIRPQSNMGTVMKMKKKKISCRKRRRATAGIRRPAVAVERRVRELKKLIPNAKSTRAGGLFRETADYILGLEMRVRVMQIMVQVLTPHITYQT